MRLERPSAKRTHIPLALLYNYIISTTGTRTAVSTLHIMPQHILRTEIQHLRFTNILAAERVAILLSEVSLSTSLLC